MSDWERELPESMRIMGFLTELVQLVIVFYYSYRKIIINKDKIPSV